MPLHNTCEDPALFDFLFERLATPQEIDLAAAMLMAWQFSPSLSGLRFDPEQLIAVVREVSR